MTMRSRLHRLLGGKSRFRKSATTEKDQGGVPDAEVASAGTVSLGAAYSNDDCDYEQQQHCHSPTGSSLSSSLSEEQKDVNNDPYADVREELERRAQADKAQHVNGHYGKKSMEDEFIIPSFTAYTVYLGYAVMIFWGHVRDFCAFIFQRGRFVQRSSSSASRDHVHMMLTTSTPSDNPQHFAPLLKSWEHFYTRRLYTKVQDAFNRPIASNPGAYIDVLERVSDDRQKSFHVLGLISDNENGNDNLDTQQQRDVYRNGPHYKEVETAVAVSAENGSSGGSSGGGATKIAARRCLNLGSYNYLGFADDWMNTCGRRVKASLLHDDMPVSMSASRNEYGTTILHRQLEETVAAFLGKEDAIVLNMGFNTNATTIPALVGRGDLVISDELNHTSIVNGARASGSAIRIFRHNDTSHLEEILRQAIVLGRPRTRRPWSKILVIVEGVYSMEGEYCDLRNICRICKKYGAYVYLDEAHSIGAMGATGRGVAEYTGVDTADIDIMMGTFTKSFGGMGGYIAASKETIAFLRQKCAGSVHHNSLSPIVCQQCLSAFRVIMGKDGTNIGKQKIQALRDNSNYFRMRLEDMGLQVMGRYDSPIMPMMLYNPTKISAFSRECFKRGLAVVVVGFPAVPILVSRARFCISAGHTRQDLDRALAEIDQVADICKIRYNRSIYG